MAFDYTTPDDVFAYGNSVGTSTDPVDEPALMAELVTGYSRAIDQYCNQAFSLATYADQALRAVIDADGVLTCYPPVPTMAAPTVASYSSGGSSVWSDLSGAAFDIEEHTFGCVARMLDRSFASARGARLRLRLSYTGGYANLAALPNDFDWAMRALCWWAYQKRSAPADRTAIPEMGIVIVPSNWPPHIKGMFKNYVRQVPM